MTRQTSIEVYNQIRTDGILGRLQLSVYDTLFNHGPLTQGETCDLVDPSLDTQCIIPRFAELERAHAVYVCGKRPCRRTGRTCLVWDVTDQLPVMPPPRKPKDQIIAEQQERIRQLEAEVARLRVPQMAVSFDGNQGRFL